MRENERESREKKKKVVWEMKEKECGVWEMDERESGVRNEGERVWCERDGRKKLDRGEKKWCGRRKGKSGVKKGGERKMV